MTAGLRSWAGLARSLVIYRARPVAHRPARALLPRHRRARAISPSTSAPMPATAPARCSRAGARVVALEPQRLFHAFLAPRPAGRRHAPAARRRPRARARAALAVSRLHPTVSSLAAGFAARHGARRPASPRVRWDAAETVEVTTLDALIAAHGLPRFVKIDVEGFEAEVLAGLGQPVPWVAFEYLPAALDTAAACVARLAALGRYDFNLVPGESPRLRAARLARRRRHRRRRWRARRATAAPATSTPGWPRRCLRPRRAPRRDAGRGRSSCSPLSSCCPTHPGAPRARGAPPAAARAAARSSSCSSPPRGARGRCRAALTLAPDRDRRS